jgi:uncharacterized protein DUF4154
LPLCVAIAVLTCTLCPLPGGAAPNEKPSAYDVEAAYLFNFGKFVTWPANSTAPNQPLTICVLGEDPLSPPLDRLVTGEKIDGKSVVDKKISRPEDALNCSILYISSSEAARLNRILAVLKDAPVLTVSDIPDFTERGGMIQFVLRDNRVRFTVNLPPVQHDHLTLSSELLKVAVDVRRGEGSR